jgi:hypothetical protein
MCALTDTTDVRHCFLNHTPIIPHHLLPNHYHQMIVVSESRNQTAHVLAIARAAGATAGRPAADPAAAGWPLTTLTGIATTPTVVGVGVGVHAGSVAERQARRTLTVPAHTGCTGWAAITTTPTVAGVGRRVHTAPTTVRQAGGTAHSIGAVARTAVTILRAGVPIACTDTRPLGTGLTRWADGAAGATIVGVGAGIYTGPTAAGLTRWA